MPWFTFYLSQCNNMYNIMLYWTALKWHSTVQLIPSPFTYSQSHIGGLVEERCNSSALAMELRLSCINLLMCTQDPNFVITVAANVLALRSSAGTVVMKLNIFSSKYLLILMILCHRCWPDDIKKINEIVRIFNHINSFNNPNAGPVNKKGQSWSSIINLLYLHMSCCLFYKHGLT